MTTRSAADSDRRDERQSRKFAEQGLQRADCGEHLLQRVGAMGGLRFELQPDMIGGAHIERLGSGGELPALRLVFREARGAVRCIAG